MSNAREDNSEESRHTKDCEGFRWNVVRSAAADHHWLSILPPISTVVHIERQAYPSMGNMGGFCGTTCTHLLELGKNSRLDARQCPTFISRAPSRFPTPDLAASVCISLSMFSSRGMPPCNPQNCVWLTGHALSLVFKLRASNRNYATGSVRQLSRERASAKGCPLTHLN